MTVQLHTRWKQMEGRHKHLTKHVCGNDEVCTDGTTGFVCLSVRFLVGICLKARRVVVMVEITVA